MRGADAAPSGGTSEAVRTRPLNWGVSGDRGAAKAAWTSAGGLAAAPLNSPGARTEPWDRGWQPLNSRRVRLETRLCARHPAAARGQVRLRGRAQKQQQVRTRAGGRRQSLLEGAARAGARAAGGRGVEARAGLGPRRPRVAAPPPPPAPPGAPGPSLSCCCGGNGSWGRSNELSPAGQTAGIHPEPPGQVSQAPAPCPLGVWGYSISPGRNLRGSAVLVSRHTLVISRGHQAQSPAPFLLALLPQ